MSDSCQPGVPRSSRISALTFIAWLVAGGTLAAQTTSSPQELVADSSSPVQLTGFGVVDYAVDGRSGANQFAAAKLALGLFRELSQSSWIFGQLTTSASGPSNPDARPTEVEIDNLILNTTLPDSSVSVAIGKFDTPLGFERDDEPLNLQPTTSNNFEFARPPKMLGAIARWSPSRAVDVAGWVSNGWEGDLELNHGKTVGGRLGVRPTERTSTGAGFLYGPEGTQGATRGRYLATFDYALQPRDRWIVAGEANYGGDRASPAEPSDRWYGATATVFRQLTTQMATTVRIETFTDHDGVRTGTPQRITSVSLAPLYFVGTGGEGIFATIEHTSFRIPRLQVRGEIRWDDAHPDAPGESADTAGWHITAITQVVATF